MDPVTLISLLAGLIAIVGSTYSGFRWANSNRKQLSRLLPFGPNRKSAILKSGMLKVAVAHYPPLSTISRDPSSGNYVAAGPSFELARQLADKYDLTLELVPVRWDRLSEHLKSDGCDLAIPIFPSAERLVYGRVVGITHSVGLGAVARKGDDRISTASDLLTEELRVAVTEGEVGCEYVKTNMPTKFGSHQVLVSRSHDITDIMFAVLQKRADVAIADALSCFWFIQENDPSNDKLHNPFIGQPLETYQTGVLILKDENALAEWLDDEMISLRQGEGYLEQEAKDLSGWGNLISRRGIREGVKVPRLTSLKAAEN